MSWESALNQIKDDGFSLLYRDRKLVIEPSDNHPEELITEVMPQYLKAVKLMRTIIKFGKDTTTQWNIIYRFLMNNYVADPLQIKPIDHIVRWASNRHSYCYKDNLEADYTYHGGVYKRLQEKIPELLLQDQDIYEKLQKRFAKKKSDNGA